MPSAFEPQLIELLRAVEEVEIETRAAPEGRVHRTIIWVVVDDHGRVLVRTYLGPSSRWYRDATHQPACVLHVNGEALAVTAVAAPDAERIEACSRGYLAKYAGHRAMPAMLAEPNLGATLELLPR